jgi:hypothetical protein
MGSAIIEVGIGLVMVYFILSIVVTTINNMLVNSLNLRAENLREWFAKVITDDQVLNEILTHPMIGLIKTEDAVPKKNIVRRLFSILKNRFLDLLVPGAGDNDIPTSDVSNVAPNVFANALTGIVLKDQTLTADMPEADQVRALVDSMRSKVKNTPLEKTLETVVATAQNLQDAQAKLAAWFDSSMGQLSNLFKRRVQFISFVVAFLVATGLNVDSLQLARALWNDPALRESITVAAQRTIAASTQQPATSQPQKAADDLQQKLQPLFDLRLPIGWVISSADPSGQLNPRNLGNLFFSAREDGTTPGLGDWINYVLYKVVGLLITSFAIMQGSDFWFNLLGRLTAAKDALNKSNDAGGSQPPAQPPAGGSS